MKEIYTLLVKLHNIFSRMQRVNQHARPSIIQVGCPTCCYQVCALDHAKGGTAYLDYHSEHCHHNEIWISYLYLFLNICCQKPYLKSRSGLGFIKQGLIWINHYDVKAQSYNPGLQYPHLHGPVHTPDNNRWDTPPV